MERPALAFKRVQHVGRRALMLDLERARAVLRAVLAAPT